jgi:hypothetical protein
MIAHYRLRNVSSWTMFLFGILALLLGAVGLVSPNTLLALLNFEIIEQRTSDDYTLVYLAASSMASFNIGVYYILAALTNWKAFFGWTVPFRGVTFIVFTALVVSGTAPATFMGVALWELTGALLTGVALWYERRRETT